MRLVQTGTASLLISCLIGGASGAELCARAPELTALQVAAVQQELMVAAFACNDVTLYNRFVVKYRDELQASDDTLQAFFARKEDGTGLSDYHAYKTKMANVYSARSNADKKGYCQSAQRTFAAALSGQRKNLASFALAQPITVNEPYTKCGTPVAGGSMIAGAKTKVAEASEAPVAEAREAPKVAAQSAAAPITAAATPNPVPPLAAAATSSRSPIEKVLPLPSTTAPAAAAEAPVVAPPAPEPPPVNEKPAPMIAAAPPSPPQTPQVTEKPAPMIAVAPPPPQPQAPQVTEKSPPMIAAGPPPPEPPQAYVEKETSPPPPAYAPPASRNPARPPQQAVRPPSQYGDTFAERTPPPRQYRYPFGPQLRSPPPPYRFAPRYNAGGPYGPYSTDPYPRSPLYYYRAPDPPGFYRDYRYYDDRVPNRGLDRAPYPNDDGGGAYDNNDDRSLNRAPNDPRLYERDRYGTVQPPRY